MSKFRKICPICGSEMNLLRDEKGKWYYACPECNYTHYNDGISRWLKIVGVFLFLLFLYLYF